MEKLPPEILITIFNNDKLQEIKALIAISKVCKYFKDIIFNLTRKISINFGSSDKIIEISQQFENFTGLKIVQLEISFDAHLIEKAKFCRRHSSKITQLTLNEITFLNPVLDHRGFDNLTSLKIHKCDLASCSQTLADFIIFCPKLKHLTISICDGLDIDSLNSIGRQLHKTQIENFELFPTYSYCDTQNDTQFWRIDKLKAFSVRSSSKEIVVMKKNFVKIMLGRMICENLHKLELIAELNFGDNNFVPFLINHFPNLETLLLGRGISSMKNQDFVNICNDFKNLKTLEFHFVHHDEVMLTHLQKNLTIIELTLGLSKDISIQDLKIIAGRLPNLQKVSVIIYNISRDTNEYLKQLTNIFPIVQFQKTGQKCCQALLNISNNLCVT